jgi:hypothetical protein
MKDPVHPLHTDAEWEAIGKAVALLLGDARKQALRVSVQIPPDNGPFKTLDNFLSYYTTTHLLMMLISHGMEDNEVLILATLSTPHIQMMLKAKGRKL